MSAQLWHGRLGSTRSVFQLNLSRVCLGRVCLRSENTQLLPKKVLTTKWEADECEPLAMERAHRQQGLLYTRPLLTSTSAVSFN